MQDPVTNILWVVYAGSAVLIALCVGFVLVVTYSHNHKLRMQQEKLVETRRSEQKYKTLFNHSLAGMVKFDYETFTILDANEALLEIFLCATLLELQECLNAIDSDDRAVIQTQLKILRIIKEFEFSFVDKTGRVRWVLFSARCDRDEPTAHGVFRDITQRRIVEERNRELAALLNQTQDAIIVVSTDGMVKFWNNAASEIYGWTSEEAMGRQISALLFASEHNEQYTNALEDVLQFGEWTGEHKQKVKTGKAILVDSTWKKIENQYGSAPSLLIVNTDITEKRALEHRSLHNQKMEAIALMTSGIAHDLQNILAPVSLSLSILRENQAEAARSVILDTIGESVANGLRLVKNILMAGRGIKGVHKPVDLIVVVDAALGMFALTKPEKVAIGKHFLVETCRIQGDENLLTQVFLNLFQNAKDAMPQGGRLDVVLDIRDADEIDASFELERGSRSYALVAVGDTGIGIPIDAYEKIFEPFFTTKEGAGGTGLGLPIVRNIIRNHGGMIDVSSVEGCGTTFVIYFPLSEL